MTIFSYAIEKLLYLRSVMEPRSMASSRASSYVRVPSRSILTLSPIGDSFLELALAPAQHAISGAPCTDELGRQSVRSQWSCYEFGQAEDQPAAARTAATKRDLSPALKSRVTGWYSTRFSMPM